MKSSVLFSFLLVTAVTLTTLPPPTTAAAAATTAKKELCNPVDKKTLLAIKQSFNNAYHFDSWSPDTDCCGRSWYMVKCDPNSHRITSLTVFADTFPGTLPTLLGDLPSLQILTFHKLPNLTGSIPESLTNLQKLKYLDFSWNSLSGPIPSFLSQLHNLLFLDLSFNRFSGWIPPALASAPSLTSLRLDRNQLTGPIPDTFGSFRNSGDYYLYLSHNMLTGPIPRSMGSPRMNFTRLDLSHNGLTGDASFLFGKDKTSMQEVDLSRNSLAFDLSEVEFPTSLVDLDLNHNKVFGSLPSGLADLPMLQGFNVSYNRLCGKIPVGGRFSGFDQYSYIHNKCLCGTPLSPCTN